MCQVLKAHGELLRATAKGCAASEACSTVIPKAGVLLPCTHGGYTHTLLYPLPATAKDHGRDQRMCLVAALANAVATVNNSDRPRSASRGRVDTTAWDTTMLTEAHYHALLVCIGRQLLKPWADIGALRSTGISDVHLPQPVPGRSFFGLDVPVLAALLRLLIEVLPLLEQHVGSRFRRSAVLAQLISWPKSDLGL
jgi:hypothetical protein